MNAFIILPDQLFYDKNSIDIISLCDEIFIFEEPFYFTGYTYHRSKIILHRASMRYYYKMLKTKFGQKKKSGEDLQILIENTSGEFLGGAKKNPFVRYIPFDKIQTNYIDYMSKYKLQVNMFMPASINIWKDKLYNAKFNGLPVKFYESPNFYLDDPGKFFNTGKRHRLDAFYKKMRKIYTPKLNPKDKPYGGKWIYDKENQISAKDINVKIPPEIILSVEDKEYTKAIEYSKKFKTIGEVCRYPITYEEAKSLLNYFTKSKLKNFGKYQDAILIEKVGKSGEESSSNLFHSMLSTSINNGLLSPVYVVNKVVDFWSKRKKIIPIASIEGFVRQIFWREFIHGLYVVNVNYPDLNHFDSKRGLSEHFYNATTEYYPVDIIINKFLKTGYAHHIERLMIMNSFMLMQDINPKKVVKWFMEMQVDSAEWCMWGNCSGFSYQDNGLVSSRPYFSTSQYWLKMSNLSKDNKVIKESADKWDTLYYTFINKNKEKLKNIYFVNSWVNYWEKLDNKEKNEILNRYKVYI